MLRRDLLALLRVRRRLSLAVAGLAVVGVGTAFAGAAPVLTTANLSYTPPRLSYGGHATSSSTAMQFSITNTSGNTMYWNTGGCCTGSLPIEFAYDASFGTDANSCLNAVTGYLSAGLAPSATCVVAIDFNPTVKGRATGQYSAGWGPTNDGSTVTDTVVVNLSGTGH